jgi:predicted nucleic acid-binding protein
MKAVFADTSFFAALLNSDDVHHEQARAWSEAYAGRVIVTEYILIELGAFFARRKHRPLFLALLDDLALDPQTLIVACSRALYRRGLALFADRLDKDWSLTDCISFAVMKKRKLTNALTADHHFEQAGFRAILLHPPDAAGKNPE